MEVPSRKRARKRTAPGRTSARSKERGKEREEGGLTVGVGEEAVLERDDDELAAREARAEQATDVLGCQRERELVSRLGRRTEERGKDRLCDRSSAASISSRMYIGALRARCRQQGSVYERSKPA